MLWKICFCCCCCWLWSGVAFERTRCCGKLEMNNRISFYMTLLFYICSSIISISPPTFAIHSYIKLISQTWYKNRSSLRYNEKRSDVIIDAETPENDIYFWFFPFFLFHFHFYCILFSPLFLFFQTPNNR